MQTIYNRQSVRTYTSKEITAEVLDEIAHAALVAPSSKGKEPWEVMVIEDHAVCCEMAKVHSNWKLLDKANKCMIVYGNQEQEERIPHMLMACSAAIQNILIEATAKGIGSVWLGAYPDEVRMNWLSETFPTEKKVVPIAVIALGYPLAQKDRTYFGDKSKIHFNKW